MPSGSSGASGGPTSGTPGSSGASGASASGTMPDSEGGAAGTVAGASAGSTAGGSGGGATGTSTGADGGAPCVVGCSVPDGGGGPGDASSGDGVAGLPLPKLTSLVANQSGRLGQDLLLTLQGSDVNRAAFALDVQLGDKNGQPVNAFPNWAGTPSAYERIVLFDQSSAAGQTSFSKTVTLPGVLQTFPNIAVVVGAVVDTVGTSAAVTARVALQSVESLHQSCDPNVITSRCSPGFACSVATSLCTAPAAPQIAKFVYVTSAQGQGARVLVAGTDPADDLDLLHLEFLDSLSHPVAIDLTGNQDLATTFDLSVADASKLGQFFYADQTAQGFDSTVTQLAVTPSGASSGTGARVTAMLEAPPVVSTGGVCDLRGFASCAAGDSCVHGSNGASSTCVVTATALSNAAAAAPTLDPSAGPLVATGYALSANLWGDPPSDCVPPGVRGLPEGIVLLHLADTTPSLTLTTDNPETNLDAAIFVLDGQGASVGTQSLGCNEGYPSTLTLTDLAAGDYTIVVGSTTAAGGNFGLRIE